MEFIACLDLDDVTSSHSCSHTLQPQRRLYGVNMPAATLMDALVSSLATPASPKTKPFLDNDHAEALPVVLFVTEQVANP